jgi:hypothetical protein
MPRPPAKPPRTSLQYVSNPSPSQVPCMHRLCCRPTPYIRGVRRAPPFSPICMLCTQYCNLGRTCACFPYVCVSSLSRQRQTTPVVIAHGQSTKFLKVSTCIHILHGGPPSHSAGTHKLSEPLRDPSFEGRCTSKSLRHHKRRSDKGTWSNTAYGGPCWLTVSIIIA